MAYRFKLDESLTKGVRRIGVAQLELAERRLKEASDPAVAVHEVRKSLKRLRALLRLARPALDEKTYGRENAELRKAGRALSDARDRDVMQQTLTKLEARLKPHEANATRRMRELLDQGNGNRASRAHQLDIRKARASVAAAKRRFVRLKAEADGFDALGEGLRKSYRAGRRAIDQVQDGADGEHYHELRKAVQQHWRQMLLVQRAWPEVCKARAAAAREIAQVLGEEHDYAVLAARAEALRGHGLEDDAADVIVGSCTALQGELRAQATPKARRLFAGRPKSFAEQIVACWSASRELDRLEAQTAEDDATELGQGASEAVAGSES